MKKTGQTKPWKHLAAAALKGTAAALAVCALACMLCAVLIKNKVIPENALRLCAVSICSVAAIVGCVSAQHMAGMARLPVSLTTGILLMLCLVTVRMVMRTGSPASWSSAAATGVCAVATALIGAGRGR